MNDLRAAALAENLRILGCPVDDLLTPVACMRACEHGMADAGMVGVVGWLCAELRILLALDEHVNINNSETIVVELTSMLVEMGCPHRMLTVGAAGTRLSTPHHRYTLLEYLCSELQAARMQQSAHDSHTPDNATVKKIMHLTETPSAGCLRRALVALQLGKPPDNIDCKTLFAKINFETKTRLSSLPADFALKVVQCPLISGGILNDKQWTRIEQLNEDMRDEYQMRAELLLKRLDVTIQSFTWSDRVHQKENDLFAVYRPLRAALRSESVVTVAHILAARADLARVEKTSYGSGRSVSRLNRVLMSGVLPDRGGRPAEIERPPPEMPAWQKHRASGAQPQRQHNRGRGGSGASSGWSGVQQQKPDYHYNMMQQPAQLQYGNPVFSSPTATLFNTTPQFQPYYEQQQSAPYAPTYGGDGGDYGHRGGRGSQQGRGRGGQRGPRRY